MLNEERQKLLDELGPSDHTLVWDRSLTFSWAVAYYMLFLFPCAIPVAFLPISSSDARIGIWLALPILPSVLCGLIYASRAKGKSVQVNQEKFSLVMDGTTRLTICWNDIASIIPRRHGLEISLSDGSLVNCKLPELKISPIQSIFKKALRTYYQKDRHVAFGKKAISISLISGVIGSIGACLVGRPRLLKPDIEPPILIFDWIWIGVWSICVLFIVAGVFGIAGILDIYVLKGAMTKAVEKERRYESEFGPNLTEYVHSKHDWLKPVELMQGKIYRYVSPTEAKFKLREQVVGMWVLFGITLFLTLGCVAAMTFDRINQLGEFGWKILLLVSGGAGLIWVCYYIAVLKKRQNYLGDEISVTDTHLIRKRAGETKYYPRHPHRLMKNGPAGKQAILPLAQVERHGARPDFYEIDRRYLMEVSSGLPSQHVVGDGVEHISG